MSDAATWRTIVEAAQRATSAQRAPGGNSVLMGIEFAESGAQVTMVGKVRASSPAVVSGVAR